MSEELNNRVDEALANMRAPFGPKEASWERLMLRTKAEEQKQSKSWMPMIVGIAAGLALLLGVFTFMGNHDSLRIETALAQQETISLPDGSTVTLNASSMLEYDAESFLEDRVLYLDGEAFFQVKKGSKFSVSTDQGTVSVLGTSFNVCDRDDRFEVQCKTGKVAVADGEQEVILTPGLATDNSQGTLADAYAIAVERDWTNGVFSFDADPMTFVLSELERQFDVSISAQGTEDLLYTGEFNKNDLETALMVVCGPMGLDYRIDAQDQVTITPK